MCFVCPLSLVGPVLHDDHVFGEEFLCVCVKRVLAVIVCFPLGIIGRL